MASNNQLPESLEDALSAGFRRFQDLPEKIQSAVRSRDKAAAKEMEFAVNVCGPGQTGPCSTTVYPDGTRKVCYCNAAHQCDDCVFQTPMG